MEEITDKRIGFLMERSARSIKLAFVKAFNKLDIDITPDQYVVLDLVKKAGSLSQRDLTEQTYKDAPTVSRIIDLLVKKHFVRRENVEGDRRKTLISLTLLGQQIFEDTLAEVEALRNKTLDGLSASDINDLKRITDQIVQNLKDYE